jgi:predicted F0F1-ATPase subunit
MKRAAAKKSTTDTAVSDIEQYVSDFSARQVFLGAVLTLSWRLALTVLIPLIGGIQLDKRFDSSPSYTITGFMIAVLFGCMAVWQTVKEVNASQAEENKGKKQ